MVAPRERLENYIYKKCDEVLSEKEAYLSVAKIINEKFNIQEGKIMDVISRRVSLDEFSEFMLFCVLYGIDQYEGKNRAGRYFTEIEISNYMATVIEDDDKVKFPITIPCHQVSYDQWIGVVDVEFLMKLRNSQMIIYNANTQRTMTKTVRRGVETYKITINKDSVQEIREAYDKEVYIPDELTLNIPIDERNVFHYDDKNRQLVISKLNGFDILDGYHRYIAISQKKDLDPNFNYPIELRVVNFTETKAKQFIYQKDQKTKMRKINSDTMNMQNPANIVAERLNGDVMFYMKGEIQRNGGKIPFAEFSNLTDKIFFAGHKQRSMADLMKVSNQIRDGFNTLLSVKPELIEVLFERKMLIILLLMIKNQIKPTDYATVYNSTFKRVEEMNPKKFSLHVLRTPLFQEVENIIKEESCYEV